MKVLERRLFESLGLLAMAFALSLVSVIEANAQDSALTAWQSYAVDAFKDQRCVSHAFTIPAGKRFVLERISMQLVVNKGEEFDQFRIETPLTNSGTKIYLNFPNLVWREATADHYVLNQTTRLYTDAIFRVFVCRLSVKPNPNVSLLVHMGFVGYLVDIPATSAQSEVKTLNKSSAVGSATVKTRGNQ